MSYNLHIHAYMQNISIRLHHYKGFVSFVGGSMALGLTKDFKRHSVSPPFPNLLVYTVSNTIALEIAIAAFRIGAV